MDEPRLHTNYQDLQVTVMASSGSVAGTVPCPLESSRTADDKELETIAR